MGQEVLTSPTIPAGSVEQVDRAFVALWHSECSAENAAIAIADLIDPDDPYKYGFDFDAPWELTDQDSSGWPTILGQATVTLADGSTQDY